MGPAHGATDVNTEASKRAEAEDAALWLVSYPSLHNIATALKNNALYTAQMARPRLASYGEPVDRLPALFCNLPDAVVSVLNATRPAPSTTNEVDLGAISDVGATTHNVTVAPHSGG